VCNDVCPWNVSFAQSTGNPAYQEREDPGHDPEYFDRMSEEEFSRRYADTPLSRPGLAGMRRNWRAALSSKPGSRE
jgi:epoxyqueuosine reductase QueG